MLELESMVTEMKNSLIRLNRRFEEWKNKSVILKIYHYAFSSQENTEKRLEKTNCPLAICGTILNSLTYMLLKSEDKKRMRTGRRKYLKTMTKSPHT